MVKKSVIHRLVQLLVKQEGKKSNVKIGDVREIVSILSDLFYIEFTSGAPYSKTFMALVVNGARRREKRAGKKVK